MSKPSPAPGQVWKYRSHCQEVYGVVRGQNADGSWLLHSFSWFAPVNGFLCSRENLFATSDFADSAEYVGLIANNPEREAMP